jgi:hypothetical protein
VPHKQRADRRDERKLDVEGTVAPQAEIEGHCRAGREQHEQREQRSVAEPPCDRAQGLRSFERRPTGTTTDASIICPPTKNATANRCSQRTMNQTWLTQAGLCGGGLARVPRGSPWSQA